MDGLAGDFSPDIQSRVEVLLRKKAISWQRAAGGYSPAQRWVVAFSDGTSCFVKFPPSPDRAGPERTQELADYLRTENLIYQAVQKPFLAACLGWDDDGTQPILVLEDLSGALWPPPWSSDLIGQVREALTVVRQSVPPPQLPPVAEVAGGRLRGETWERVAEDPRPFVALGLCTEKWLQVSLPALLAAAQAAPIDGDELVHFDMRSDNICIDRGRVVIVDWNLAGKGNGELDLSSWLPSLQAEGGPLPEALMPDAPEWAALNAGFFAARAGLPTIPDAPWVRRVQLEQLRTALPWAVRALRLPPLDGSEAAR